jgi:hypothetical protein
MSISMEQQLQNLQSEMASYNAKNTKVGSTKLRKALMEVSKACSQARKDVLTSVKTLPTKTRVKKEQVSDMSEDSLSDSSQDAKPVKKTRKSSKTM